MSTTTQQVFEKLLASYGPQHWWPGDSPLEVMIGAVLVQNTAWKNVERAIDNLRAANLLDAEKILALEDAQLEDLIRPAGYFRRKAVRLRRLLEFFVHEYGGSIAAMQASDVHSLREGLLGVSGVGPETADAILLYALEKTVMVVDAYTHRVFARHGWVPYDFDYHQLQDHVLSELPVDAATYNELHALLVQVGKDFCRKAPRCEQCPLVEMLPDAGMVQD
ncbi:MAG: endonuclease III domain-containing protein [Bythopirellula sp.]